MSSVDSCSVSTVSTVGVLNCVAVLSFLNVGTGIGAKVVSVLGFDSTFVVSIVAGLSDPMFGSGRMIISSSMASCSISILPASSSMKFGFKISFSATRGSFLPATCVESGSCSMTTGAFVRVVWVFVGGVACGGGPGGRCGLGLGCVGGSAGSSKSNSGICVAVWGKPCHASQRTSRVFIVCFVVRLSMR